MGIHIEPYTDDAGEYRWRIVDSDNGKTMADSSEGYKEERDRNHAIARLVGDIGSGDYTVARSS